MILIGFHSSLSFQSFFLVLNLDISFSLLLLLLFVHRVFNMLWLIQQQISLFFFLFGPTQFFFLHTSISSFNHNNLIFILNLYRISNKNSLRTKNVIISLLLLFLIFSRLNEKVYAECKMNVQEISHLLLDKFSNQMLGFSSPNFLIIITFSFPFFLNINKWTNNSCSEWERERLRDCLC